MSDHSVLPVPVESYILLEHNVEDGCCTFPLDVEQQLCALDRKYTSLKVYAKWARM